MNNLTPDGPMSRVLVVQCCHLPQFFYTVEQLREQHPEWRLEALVLDHPQVHFYLQRFALFQEVYFLGHMERISSPPECVIFPLLNRGYHRIRLAAWRLAPRRLQVDFNGHLKELHYGQLLRSFFRPPAHPTPEFVAYLEQFPHRPLGEKILFLETCDESLVEATRKQWEPLLPRHAEVTRLRGGSLWRHWQDLPDRHFDGAIVFFSGEKGHAGLKWLPFLLRIPKILVFNEAGGYFYARPRWLLRFFLDRIRSGITPGRERARILLIQTETPRYVSEALRRLKTPQLFPNSEVMLLCREEDRSQFEGLESADRIVTFRPGQSPGQVLALLRELNAFDADCIFAVMTGRPTFRKQKLFFFLSAVRHHYVFNAQLDVYRLTPRSALHLARREPLLYDPDAWAPAAGPRVLFVQTETVPYVKEALRRLKDRKIFPQAEVLLVCREEDRTEFEGRAEVSRLLTFRAGQPMLETLKLLRRVRDFDADCVSAVITGRPLFRKQKLFFFLSGIRPHYVFNAGLDLYRLTTRSALRLVRREPLLFDPDAWAPAAGPRVLFLQTETVPYVKEALRRLKGRKIFPQAEVLLICREEDRAEFEGRAEVSRLLTFRAGQPMLETFKLLRRVREFDADCVSAVITGRPLFRKQKLFFFLSGIRPHYVFNAGLDLYRLTTRSALRLVRREPLLYDPDAWAPAAGPRVLFVQTETVPYVKEALRRLKDRKIFPQGEVLLVCREEDRAEFEGRAEVSRLLTFRAGQPMLETFKLLRRVREFDADCVSAVITGRPLFRKQKLFFFLSGIRPHYVFNAGLDLYRLTTRSALRLVRREPLLYDPDAWAPAAGPRVLFVQTETVPYVKEALRRLKDRKIFPQAEVLLICREEDRTEFEGRAEVSRVLTFQRSRPLREVLKLRRQISEFDPDCICGILSGRRAFRKQKLYYFLSGIRPHYAFNAGLEFYRLTSRSIGRVFRREPLLFQKLEDFAGQEMRVLLIQSDADSRMLRVLEKLENPQVVPRARVIVFCREDKRPVFLGQKRVSRVVGYRPGHRLQSFRALRRVLDEPVDIVAAVFSRRPIYRIQRLLFFLIPASGRLVFNENLDCYYLDRKNFWRLLQRGRHYHARRGLLIQALRPVLKIGLFLPRFVYLVIWVTILKIRRAYTLGRGENDFP